MVRRLGLGEKQPSDLRQSCAQPSIISTYYTMAVYRSIHPEAWYVESLLLSTVFGISNQVYMIVPNKVNAAMEIVLSLQAYLIEWINSSKVHLKVKKYFTNYSTQFRIIYMYHKNSNKWPGIY